MGDCVIAVGVGGGIGGEVARQLIARGVRVVGTVLDAQERARVETALPGLAAVEIVDLSDAPAAKLRFVDIMAAQQGRLIGVAGCAGATAFGPVEAISIEGLAKLLHINALSNLALYQAALPHLRETHGNVVVVSSYAGVLGFPLFSEYSSTKHALEGLMNIARLEATQWGVGVALVVPGGVKTPMTSDLPAKLDARLQQLSPAARNHYRAYFEQYTQAVTVAVESYVEPQQVADAVVEALFARPPQPRYIVGQDATDLIGQKKILSDVDFDGLIRSIFPGADQVRAEA